MSKWREFLIPGLIAAVLATVGDVLVAIVWTLPPGYATTSSSDQTVTGQVFAIIAWSVGIAVVTFGLYAILRFGRAKEAPAPPPGGHLQAHIGLQASWIGASAVLVLFAAGFGVVELEGQVSPRLAVPASALAAGAANDPLIIQVIGQQWQFTYRYPQFGGFETQQLRLPIDRLIQFDVTSLDVTHSFWAYQLGVKIDANSGVNNVGYIYVTKPTVIDVRCGELCGLWHGYMTDVGSQAGEALTPEAFGSWLAYAQKKYGPEEKYLPKFSLTYFPQPTTY